MIKTQDTVGTPYSKDEARLSFSLCAIVIGLYMTNLSEGLAHMIGISASLVSLLCKAFILLSLLVCVGALLRRLNRMMLISVCLLVAFSAVNLLLFPDNVPYFTNTLTSFLITILPGMICLMAIRDYDKLLKYIIVSAVIISIVNTLIVLVGGAMKFSSSYSMGYANSMILPTNTLIFAIFEQKCKRSVKIAYIVLAAANVISVMAFGSRGALLAIIVLMLLLCFKLLKRKTDIIIVSIIASLLLICVAFYKRIFEALYNFLLNMGYYSRTLYLIYADLGHDSGRSEIWGSVIEDISKNPFIAHGVNGDYTVAGIYSHNIALELIHSLGILFGVLALLFITYKIIRSVFSKNTSYSSVRMLIMFSFFPVCLFSSSVWTNMYLWLWLIICLRESNVIKPISPPQEEIDNGK